MVSWLICYILTICDLLPPDPAQYGHVGRTDLKENVVSGASWFTFPYPGKLKNTILCYVFLYFHHRIIHIDEKKTKKRNIDSEKEKYEPFFTDILEPLIKLIFFF